MIKAFVVIVAVAGLRLAHERLQITYEDAEPDPANALSGEIKTIQALQPEAEAVQPQIRSTLAKEPPFINSLGMKFVPVPGTKVLFCIHETRNADYAVCAAAQSGVDQSWRAEAGDGKDQHPVVNVSYEDAEKFCQWLSAKEGKTYRLPTDEEWSAAVGLVNENGRTPEEKSASGPEGVHPWGKYYPPKPTDGNYNLSGFYDGYAGVAPVMSFRSNALGIYDLGGNVWEWCQGWYNEGHYLRFVRGGCCADDNHWRKYMRSSFRYFVPPMFSYKWSGFRCTLMMR
jgi:hypothetical protein